MAVGAHPFTLVVTHPLLKTHIHHFIAVGRSLVIVVDSGWLLAVRIRSGERQALLSPPRSHDSQYHHHFESLMKHQL